MTSLEHEAKFWLPSFLGIRTQIHALRASLITPRHLERNLRFDTPDRALTNRGEVLRLREAQAFFITYKRPSERYEIRQEWELEVHDFEQARGLLEGLGYEVIHCYEKYREVYKLRDCLVMLDEVPYGCFVEIEGPDLETIRSMASRLQLNWDVRIQRTYMDLFEAVSSRMKPKPDDATFDAFLASPGTDASALDLPSGYLRSNEEVEQE